MEYLDTEKIWIFIILFFPGFISVKIHRLLVAEEKYDFSKNLLEIIGFSLLNLIFFLWLVILNIYHDWLFACHWLFFLSIVLIFIIGPTCWPILFLLASRSKFLSKYIVHGPQTPWDSVFEKRECYWVILTLSNDKRIGGKYGLNSFSSSYPRDQKIYLEEQWEVDENRNFLNKIENSHGILIVSEEIKSIEFFKFT